MRSYDRGNAAHEQWLRDLGRGGSGAERRMRRVLGARGELLPPRSSARAGRIAAALGGTRPGLLARAAARAAALARGRAHYRLMLEQAALAAWQRSQPPAEPPP
jgi:hypothetical protein